MNGPGPLWETNEELSRRYGFTYTDEHRRLETAVRKLEQRVRGVSPERPSLTLIRGGVQEEAAPTA